MNSGSKKGSGTMENRVEINKLENSGNTRTGTQVSGSANVHGNIQTDQSIHHNYNAETLILNQNKGQIDPINFNFDLESLQGTTANRNVELEQMRAVLAKPTKGSGVKFVVVHGMGGAGKTTLAKMYFKAENDREAFDHLIWIDAEEPENVRESFKQLLADYLDVHRQFAGEQQLINAVYNSILKQKTIIVFDNVEQVERIRQFFPKLVSPKNPPPHVIVTTRNSGGWQDYKDHLVHVGELSMEICEVYIRDSLATLKITDVDRNWAGLADHFGCLVMALRTATMSIVEQNQLQDSNDREPYKLEDFLKEVKKSIVLEEENEDLFDPVEATYRPLKQLWNATLDRLSKQPYGQLGERILEVLAFLSPTGVPVEWFSIICADFIGSSDRMMMNATHFMISRSFVTKSEKKYIVHRVFQTTLLSRIKAKREKLTATLDWLLPRIEQLFLKFAAENKLQDFYPHLNTLAKNIELRGNVPDSVVSFLVNMKLAASYTWDNLRKKLVKKLLEKDVSVSCKSLELVLAQSAVKKRVLLLPMWIRDYSDKMPIEEQLQQIYWSLNPYNSILLFRQTDSLIAVVQVLEKWKPESSANSEDYSVAQPELDILNIVECLCEGLHEWIPFLGRNDGRRKVTTYNEIHTVLHRLKKVLAAAETVVFHQSKVDNLEVKLKYIDVVNKWFQNLVRVESCSIEPEFAWCDVTELESAFNFSFTGVDHVMIGWYQEQLQRLYRNYRRELRTRMKLEATFIALVVTILVKSLSDSEQDQSNVADANKSLIKNKAKIPDQVIQFLNFSKDRKFNWTKDDRLHRFMRAYFVYLALEPHLDLLERILARLEEATDVHQRQQIIVEIEPFVESIRGNISEYKWLKLKDTGSLLDIFSKHFDHCDDPVESKKRILPNVEKLAEVTDKILAHCDDQFSTRSHGGDPERLIWKLEDAYERHQGPEESAHLRTALEQALKTAQALEGSSDKKYCECIVARIQTMLAGLDLEDSKTEAAIQLATEAFNHKLYCYRSWSRDGTIAVLFDAFDKCGDSEVQKLDLLRKLCNGHVDIYGPNHRITAGSLNKLIYFLCSTGSILEAADLAEKYIDGSGYIIIDNYTVLTVPLLLLLSGENERVVSLSECLLRNAKATALDSEEQRLYDEICHFATLLREVGAPGLASFKDYETKEIRKCALTLIYDPFVRDWQPPRIYQEWIDNGVKFLHVNDKITNEEETGAEKRLIDTTELLDDDTLWILWFDTMEQALRRDPKDISASLFAPLVRQMELLNAGTEFKLNENSLEWSVKCFVGMFQRQLFWFQKSIIQTDKAEEPYFTCTCC